MLEPPASPSPLQAPFDAPPAAAAPLHGGPADRSGRELRIPIELLHQVGVAGGDRALEAAGTAAGHWLSDLLRESLGAEALAHAPSHAFWEAVDAHLRERGWGRWRETRIHPGLSVVMVEEGPDFSGKAGGNAGTSNPGATPGPQPSSPFLHALLLTLLRAAGGEGLEVVILPGETDTTRVAFGAPAAARALAAGLRQGMTEEEALAAL